MILAYVEGLPIPSSSSVLISDAALYLGGGSVSCAIWETLLHRMASSLFTFMFLSISGVSSSVSASVF